MMNEFFFPPPPRPIRRQLNYSYPFEGARSQDDPLDYNTENELQERIDRLRAIIDMDRNNPEVADGALVRFYQPYLNEAEAIMAARNMNPAP